MMLTQAHHQYRGTKMTCRFWQIQEITQSEILKERLRVLTFAMQEIKLETAHHQ